MKQTLQSLNINELEQLEEAVKLELYKQLEIEINSAIFDSHCSDEGGKYRCHLCSSVNTYKSGINKQGKQRYHCADCKKTRIAQQNTITFSTKKDFSQWALYLQSMLDGDSLMVSAEKAGISKRTAFRWRHKILIVLNNRLNQAVLYDVVHLDETMFPVVYKSRTIGTSQEKSKRGMSNQKVNVTCAIDSHGQTILKVADQGRVNAQTLIDIYSNKISEDSIVVSDSLRSYHKLMSHLGVVWKKIPSKKKSFEQYTLDPVNHLHALIKDFFFKYKGISLKYLQGYLGLFDFLNKHRNYYNRQIFKSILIDVFSSLGHLKCSIIDSNSTIYS